ncbi:hypothetical protein Ahy_A06g030086 isoform B [Arachis hypogaea]|uniref:Auxin efflux carrier component n=1 Tax=Arachis hypogaea TaxID=3818 RepID=A0A445CV63_ARAHY|nr:hypothetical protein Ahy_A06g030086 isoform B [Arachis hypogaea]
MIRGDDLYKVMCAMVPLYFAMLVAYGSVKWCKIFNVQRSTVLWRFSRFLCCPFTSSPSTTRPRPSRPLRLGHVLQKSLLRLGGDAVLISLATLSNTLVTGIPLLQAMYGDFTHTLMVHSSTLPVGIQSRNAFDQDAIPGTHRSFHHQNRT